CAQAPARLAGVEEFLASRGVEVAWRETLHPDPAPNEPITPVVCRLCLRLARAVTAVLRDGAVPLVLGGDHSIAMGTWRGVTEAAGAPIGLLWIDAHLDAHTHQTSHSGRLHGMPLAALLGQGGEGLCAERAVLQPQHVCVVGARSFEPEEAALLAALGVRVYSMREIEQRSLKAVLEEALARVRGGTAGYGVSIDLDAVDPADAPGVTTPVPHGLRGEALSAVLGELAGGAPPLAVEIAEFDPHRDIGGVTARLVLQLAASLLAAAKTVKGPSALELERRCGAANYDPLPVVLVRGSGIHVWDEAGRRYLDFMSAYSALSLGHAHPRILAALTAQAGRLALTSRAFYNDRLGGFLAKLCGAIGMDRALPMNTGMEAVETALKAARKWAYQVKRVPRGRAEIIACEGNFHGRSIAITAMSTEAQYRRGFGPFPGGFRLVPFGDAQALERAITKRTAAFLAEPIQGERGIVVPPPGYLARCAEICREHDVLFIADEVQTGLGRTGRMLACDHEGVKPDGLVLGKALGGGMLPVSAFLAREDVMAVFRPGDHGSTFGGNPLAAAVGIATLEVLDEERLPERAARLGARLMAGLQAIDSPLVREVRGKGLLVGVDIDPARASARRVVDALLARGVLSRDTHGSVVRLAPPLVIGEEDIDFAVEALRAALAVVQSGG
ncbi:MAG: ornithine--oxo-acid transaminase, partial [Burkholderiales bacterium]|nr:ornithine--oxo-acid transaminase [Burkholderiales bacterium]